jgi:predicted RNase H-like nuclease (RuvC/YqgF family)
MEAVQSTKSNSNVSADTKARLSVLENNVAFISTSVEKLETKIDNNYATLHSRISDLRDDLRFDFESKNEKVIQKIEEHTNSSNEHNKELNRRIDGIERWRWMIMGGALVIGYILAHVKLENFF